MKIKAILVLTVLALGTTSCQNRKTTESTTVSIIPEPMEMIISDGEYQLPKKTKIFLHSKNTELKSIAEYLIQRLRTASKGFKFEIAEKAAEVEESGIHFVINEEPSQIISDEGYYLDIENSVIITANTPQGIFYGVQTLFQLMPPEIMGSTQTVAQIELPTLSITDKPRFAHRGMMLDVCRHFVGVDSVKRFIDLIAMHKMNSFHWHLTEDQGWRIEIKNYPLLTEIGSKRHETIVEKNFDPYIGDGTQYEGYYTQEDILDIVAYAAGRYINIIPEIEFPGHSGAALASYPYLGCTGGPYEVETTWGVHPDVYCAGNDSVFQFAEDVLTQVMELFPSKIIHIGGDECPKIRWKECPKCQARIKEEGLKDEYELQSYFIKRLEKIINKNGRTLIGWDEILEGGLAPNAMVMSWRGTQGGIEAARQKHFVVMSPGTHCYFDHYQGDPELEPFAIGGYTPLKKVYSYEPIPEELNKEEAKYILGAQANVWTEYMPTYKHMEYMVTPRISALAEVVWSPAEKRDWEDFQKRLKTQTRRFDAMNVNYSKGSFRISFIPEFDSINQQLSITMETESSDIKIHFTIDGSEPKISDTEYLGPIPVNKTTMLKAGAFVDGKQIGKAYEKEIILNKAVGAKVNYIEKYSPKYTAGGELGLVDGISSPPTLNKELWQGFNGIDFEVVIELNEKTEISKISTGFLHKPADWIYRPQKVVYYISADGKKFEQLTVQQSTIVLESNEEEKEIFTKLFSPVKVKFVKIFAEGVKQNPAWHKYPGELCWVFVDEIVIE